MSSALLKIDNLAVSYQTRRGDVAAVSGVSLEVHPGEITAIVGESGSGKSTSAMAAIGLLPRNASIDTGEVHFKGRHHQLVGRRMAPAARPADCADPAGPEQFA